MAPTMQARVQPSHPNHPLASCSVLGAHPDEAMVCDAADRPACRPDGLPRDRGTTRAGVCRARRWRGQPIAASAGSDGRAWGNSQRVQLPTCDTGSDDH
jgi:hypothetical protein